MGNSEIDFHAEIKSRYGNIKRARGYYLYTEKGARLLDMYLDGGRAVLGRRNGTSSLAFKQMLDRGLIGDFSSVADSNFAKGLKSLFPECTCFRIYSSFEKAEAVLRSVLCLNETEKLPCFKPFSGEPLYKNFLFLPYMSINTTIVVFQTELNTDEKNIPPSDKILPTEKMAISRFFFDLKKRIPEEAASIINMKKNNLTYFSVMKTMSFQLEKFWTVKGLYLFPKCSETEYKDFFISALEKKIFISPDFCIPSVFPILQSYKNLLLFLKEL